MSITPHPSVVFTDVGFSWPDGAPVLNGVTAAFGSGRTGLVGANGAGKTTLLRLISREIAPTCGVITTSGGVGRLQQDLALQPGATVSDLLRIREQLDAFRAIEAGDTDQRRLDVLGDDWDIEARARAHLDSIGLDAVDLDRPVVHLSGGEAVLIALAGLRLRRDEVVLLDEPTNNLDRVARGRLYEAVAAWRGALIVVSHDTGLLDRMDDTIELRDGSLTWFGGNFTSYRLHVERERAVAEQALRTAHQRVKTEERQRVEAQTKLARRARYARTDFRNKRKPKVVMNQRKSQAQLSEGKLRGELDGHVDAARQSRDEAADAVRRDARIRIELRDPDVPSTRRLAELIDQDGTRIELRGSERIALTGRNGVGKTRVLESVTGVADTTSLNAWGVRHTDRIGYLPQRLDGLDDAASVIDSVSVVAPDVSSNRLRAILARLMIRGDAVDRPVGGLSGGERFRVVLACLLLADPPNQLLVLDEPTNSLDLTSIDELVSSLDAYRGGLLVVSHDDEFLARLRITTLVTLDETGFAGGQFGPIGARRCGG